MATNVEDSIHFKLEAIAHKMQSINGLRDRYIVLFNPQEKKYFWMNVLGFFPDHFEMLNGAIVPYQTMSGYCYPPQEIIDKMRAKETGIDLQTKIIRN